MHNKFEINWTKIKGGCQSGRKKVPHDSKSDLPLMLVKRTAYYYIVLMTRYKTLKIISRMTLQKCSSCSRIDSVVDPSILLFPTNDDAILHRHVPDVCKMIYN